MRIELKSLKSNPVRDLHVDPIDAERVKAIANSIDENGFWGGVVVGKVNGHHVVLAGHSRVKAAMKTETHGDFFVIDSPTPETMLRIYATENATQRGTDSTSVAGTVAGAIRLIAKDIFTREITSEKRGRNHRDGIGEPAIAKFLKGIPGITENVIKQQVANLKASGHYANQITTAERELMAERVAAEESVRKAKTEKDKQEAEVEAEKKRKAEAEAKKAAKKADEIKRTFDLTGVQKHFRCADHVNTFRAIVTGKQLKDVLPIEQQAPLAAAIVTEAKNLGAELTSKFIKEEVNRQVTGAKAYVRKADKDALRLAGIVEQARYKMHHFARNISGALADAEELAAMAREHPEAGIALTQEFIVALDIVQRIAQKLTPKLRMITHAQK